MLIIIRQNHGGAFHFFSFLQDTVVGDIMLKNVSLSLPLRAEANVLQHLSLNGPSGKTLALVGASGCGKCTIMSLIERFYDPSYGAITLDGRDLRGYNIRWLRSQIGFVSQEPVLFDATIANNSRYGNNSSEVTDEEVFEAAKAANIDHFIKSLPQVCITINLSFVSFLRMCYWSCAGV